MRKLYFNLEDVGQGYLYSAAMPASDVLNWRNNETI